MPSVQSYIDRCTEDENGCWTWPHGLSNGYSQGMIDGRIVRMHRAVYEYLVRPIPKGGQLHHLCGNKACVNPSHLDLTTCSNHTALHMRGNTHAAQKLTPREVTIMLRLLDAGVMAKIIGEAFGVSEGLVSMIRHGQRRSSITRR